MYVVLLSFLLSVLTYLDVLDIVNVWDNVSKFIEKQMALQKVCKFSRVLKFLFTHVQWNVSCTANFARLLLLGKVILSLLQISFNQITINDRVQLI